MHINAKKIVFAALIAVLAVSAWQSVTGDAVHVNIDGDEFDGPLGAALGLLFTGGGLLIAALACVCATVFVGLLCASLGILMIAGLALAAIVVAAAVSPLLLPLLIPAGIYWFFTARARRQRRHALLEQAV